MYHHVGKSGDGEFAQGLCTSTIDNEAVTT